MKLRSIAAILALTLVLFLPAPAAAEPCVSTGFACTWEASTGNCGAGYGSGLTVLFIAPVTIVLQRSCFPTDDWHRVNVYVANAAYVWWDGYWPDLDRGSSIGAATGPADASWSLGSGCVIAARALTQSTAAPCPAGPPPPPSGSWGQALP